MDPRDIYITDYDLTRLKELLQVGIGLAERNVQLDRPSLESLHGELNRAHIVAPAMVPPDVVTMNSRVRITNVETNDGQIITVVFPSEANLEQGKVSILAPIGTAILGYRVGDTVEWRMPGGVKRIRIDEIFYQPEAAGHQL
jgi:regulator of nucleoside diphosphate kinase